MTKVIYVAADGTRTEIDARDGDTVMSTAVSKGIREIVGDCGGAMACATCHVFVDAAWADKTGARSANEESMLEFAATEMQDNSRLSCQITITPELDGLVIHMPEDQM